MDVRATIQDRRHRAVTLLEVLVAIAAAAVIFAIAMGILITTNQTANRAIAHESLLQQAELAMKKVQSAIEATVWPEDVASSPPTQAALVFTTNSLALLSSWHPTRAGRFCRYEFVTIEKVPDKGDVRTIAGYLCDDPGGGPKPTFEKLGGEFDSAIQFRYATQVGPDLQPVWQESLPTGQKPRLIWIELVVRDPERRDRRGQIEEMRLTTAISL